MDIFGDIFGCDPAHVLQSFASDNRWAAAPDSTIGVVLAGLNDSEEQGLLMPFEGSLVVLNGIAIEELLRTLNEGELLIADVAQGAVKETRLGNHVCIQDGDKFPFCPAWGIVYVPRLGVLVGGAC